MHILLSLLSDGRDYEPISLADWSWVGLRGGPTMVHPAAEEEEEEAANKINSKSYPKVYKLDP